MKILLEENFTTVCPCEVQAACQKARVAEFELQNEKVLCLSCREMGKHEISTASHEKLSRQIFYSNANLAPHRAKPTQAQTACRFFYCKSGTELFWPS